MFSDNVVLSPQLLTSVCIILLTAISISCHFILASSSTTTTADFFNKVWTIDRQTGSGWDDPSTTVPPASLCEYGEYLHESSQEMKRFVVCGYNGHSNVPEFRKFDITLDSQGRFVYSGGTSKQPVPQMETLTSMLFLGNVNRKSSSSSPKYVMFFAGATQTGNNFRGLDVASLQWDARNFVTSVTKSVHACVHLIESMESFVYCAHRERQGGGAIRKYRVTSDSISPQTKLDLTTRQAEMRTGLLQREGNDNIFGIFGCYSERPCLVKVQLLPDFKVVKYSPELATPAPSPIQQRNAAVQEKSAKSETELKGYYISLFRPGGSTTANYFYGISQYEDAVVLQRWNANTLTYDSNIILSFSASQQQQAVYSFQVPQRYTLQAVPSGAATFTYDDQVFLVASSTQGQYPFIDAYVAPNTITLNTGWPKHVARSEKPDLENPFTHTVVRNSTNFTNVFTMTNSSWIGFSSVNGAAGGTGFSSPSIFGVFEMTEKMETTITTTTTTTTTTAATSSAPPQRDMSISAVTSRPPLSLTRSSITFAVAIESLPNFMFMATYDTNEANKRRTDVFLARLNTSDPLQRIDFLNSSKKTLDTYYSVSSGAFLQPNFVIVSNTDEESTNRRVDVLAIGNASNPTITLASHVQRTGNNFNYCVADQEHRHVYFSLQNGAGGIEKYFIDAAGVIRHVASFIGRPASESSFRQFALIPFPPVQILGSSSSTQRVLVVASYTNTAARLILLNAAAGEPPPSGGRVGDIAKTATCTDENAFVARGFGVNKVFTATEFFSSGTKMVVYTTTTVDKYNILKWEVSTSSCKCIGKVSKPTPFSMRRNPPTDPGSVEYSILLQIPNSIYDFSPIVLVGLKNGDLGVFNVSGETPFADVDVAPWTASGGVIAEDGFSAVDGSVDAIVALESNRAVYCFKASEMMAAGCKVLSFPGWSIDVKKFVITTTTTTTTTVTTTTSTTTVATTTTETSTTAETSSGAAQPSSTTQQSGLQPNTTTTTTTSFNDQQQTSSTNDTTTAISSSTTTTTNATTTTNTETTSVNTTTPAPTPKPTPVPGKLSEQTVEASAATANVVAGIASASGGAPAAAMTAGRALAIPQLVGCSQTNQKGEFWTTARISFPGTFLPPDVGFGLDIGYHVRAALVSIIGVLLLLLLLSVLAVILKNVMATQNNNQEGDKKSASNAALEHSSLSALIISRVMVFAIAQTITSVGETSGLLLGAALDSADLALAIVPLVFLVLVGGYSVYSIRKNIFTPARYFEMLEKEEQDLQTQQLKNQRKSKSSKSSKHKHEEVIIPSDLESEKMMQDMVQNNGNKSLRFQFFVPNEVLDASSSKQSNGGSNATNHHHREEGKLFRFLNSPTGRFCVTGNFCWANPTNHPLWAVIHKFYGPEVIRCSPADYTAQNNNNNNNDNSLRNTLRGAFAPYSLLVFAGITLIASLCAGIAKANQDMCPTMLALIAVVNTLVFAFDVFLYPVMVIPLRGWINTSVDGITAIMSIIISARLSSPEAAAENEFLVHVVSIASVVVVLLGSVLMLTVASLSFVIVRVGKIQVKPAPEYEEKISSFFKKLNLVREQNLLKRNSDDNNTTTLFEMDAALLGNPEDRVSGNDDELMIEQYLSPPDKSRHHQRHGSTSRNVVDDRRRSSTSSGKEERAEAVPDPKKSTSGSKHRPSSSQIPPRKSHDHHHHHHHYSSRHSDPAKKRNERKDSKQSSSSFNDCSTAELRQEASVQDLVSSMQERLLKQKAKKRSGQSGSGVFDNDDAEDEQFLLAEMERRKRRSSTGSKIRSENESRTNRDSSKRKRSGSSSSPSRVDVSTPRKSSGDHDRSKKEDQSRQQHQHTPRRDSSSCHYTRRDNEKEGKGKESHHHHHHHRQHRTSSRRP